MNLLKRLSFILSLIFLSSFWIATAHDDDHDETSSSKMIKEVDSDIVNHLPVLEDKDIKELGKEHQYRAEVSHLMEILINSLYTDKDVFLRELVSNAADALEKMRLLALKDPDSLKDVDGRPVEMLEIWVEVDPIKHELTIFDTGIGMTGDDLVNRLGTVASSGTGSFVDSLLKGVKSSSNLIGQFGVGFYSAFLVADKVTVISKHPSDDQHVWISNSNDHSFKVVKDPRGNLIRRGTRVVLSLTEDARSKYENPRELRAILTKYSEFLPFPIFMQPDPTKEPNGWIQVNPTKALWMKDKATITEDEYNEFYINFTRDHAPALAWTHFKAEGDTEFTSMLFVPSSNKDVYTMFSAGQVKVNNIRLYVRRVFITDVLENFLPRWMGFVRGIVDADDLPLKVDRQTFTQTRVMRAVKNSIIKKVFELFKLNSKKYDLDQEIYSEKATELFAMPQGIEKRDSINKLNEDYPDVTKYLNMWSKWGQSLMLGCSEEATKDQKQKIGEIARFPSSKSPKFGIGLDTYLNRMKPNQKDIYFITGESPEALLKSPYLEVFIKKDIEVIFLVHALEEGCFAAMEQYKDHKLKSIEKSLLQPGDLEFDDKLAAKEKEYFEGLNKYFEPLLNYISKHLGSLKASKVFLSQNLVTSPGMVSSPEYGMTANGERMARSQASAMDITIQAYAMMKNFEVNPHHPLMVGLLNDVIKMGNNKKNSEKLETKVNTAIDFFYEAGLIASGYPPRSPHLIINKLYSTVAKETGLNHEEGNEFKKTEVPQSVLDALEEEKTRKLKQEIDDEEDDPFDLDDDDDKNNFEKDEL